MEILESFMSSRLGSYFIMIAIVGIIVLFLRFLYGPKGIFRKNLWDGIDDDIADIDDTNNINNSDNTNNNTDINSNKENNTSNTSDTTKNT